MAEVIDEQKSNVKRLNAQAATADQNISATLAVVAGALGMLGAAPQAGAFAIGAGLFRLCASYRQSVANDPARDDFDQIWVSEARLDEGSLPASEPEATLYRLAAHHAVLSDELWALLWSLERHEGALAASDADSANAQADAVRQNAAACASTQEKLQELAPQVNAVWQNIRETSSLDWSSISLADVQQFFRDSWGDPPALPAPTLQAVMACVAGASDDVLEPFDAGLSDPILDAEELPAEPSALLDEGYVRVLSDLSISLRGLVAD
jgi:hypothetical protein